MRSFRIIVADVLDGLRQLPDESVQCVVSSPPYWGLRDYGTATWIGGETGCDHLEMAVGMSDKNTLGPDGYLPPTNAANVGRARQYRADCGKCGANRQDAQLGLEPTPEEYVERMVGVFREVRRVLREDGTAWINMGDSYISGQGGRQSAAGELPSTSRFDRPDPKPRPELPNPPAGWAERAVTRRTYPAADSGLKPKDLAGMPWRLAFALQADGWWLRSDIIWAKPNPMPESVTDRPTKAHEYIFLLSKSARYFYDAGAIKEPGVSPEMSEEEYAAALKNTSEAWYARVNVGSRANGAKQDNNLTAGRCPPCGRNARSVWTIATQPFPEAHFATFPEALVEPCIRAGSREGDTVLDQFCGSGTVGVVALRLGREFIGIDLSPVYAEMARRRIEGDAPLLNRAHTP